jgi:hypothetical protein
MILIESEAVLDEVVDKELLELNSMFNDNDITYPALINTIISIDKETIFNNMKYMFDLLKGGDAFFKQTDYKLCPVCKIQCEIDNTTIICKQCGNERQYDCHTADNFSLMVNNCYNTTGNSVTPFTIIGTNAKPLQIGMMKICADNSRYSDNNIKKDINNRIYQYEGTQPPDDIIDAALDIFNQIKANGRVFRGDSKWGIIGACLNYAFIKENMTKPPREIARIMDIDEKYLSQGDRVLQELNEMKIIDIPTNYNPLNDYLNQSMKILGIPLEYKEFVKHIIARAERKHLHAKNESRLTTKVVGVLYLLTRRIPELRHIKKDTISKECNNISKSTYIRYYNLICSNYVILKKSFRKYKIPQPIEWRA